MSLFAQRSEYQRSIDRVFEDFSAPSRTQAKPSRVVDADEYIQHDVKAYVSFLDTKRQE